MSWRQSSRIGKTKSSSLGWRSMYNWVSSAYVMNLIPWALITSPMGIEKSVNIRGPLTEPWGTPSSRSKLSDILHWWQPTWICFVDMTYIISALFLLYHNVHAGVGVKLGGKAYQTPRKSLEVQGQLPDVDQRRLECHSEFWREQSLWNGISAKQTD